jgi:hypothetical protein
MTGWRGIDDGEPRVAKHDVATLRDSLIVRTTMPLRVIHPLNYIAQFGRRIRNAQNP